ncbi:MAG: hypothetical protein K2P74_08705 [Nitrosomonas sp.]|nr:hypothetical protein [Nitrosomonas sp.]
MNAIEIIKELRGQNFTVKADGDYLELSPPEKITDELINRLKKHKPAIIAELKREERRNKVLAILADNPSTSRAIIADVDSDPDNVILTIAIRDQYSFEMTIPKAKYDAFILLELIEKGSLQ